MSFPSYSYTPEKLMASFRELRSKEETAPTISPADAKSGNGKFVAAAVQLTFGGLEDSSIEGFLQRAKDAVKIAAIDKKADLILLPELFLGPYFCQSQEACLQGLAMEIIEEEGVYNFLIETFRDLAKQYGVVLPISLFERKNNILYNSIVMIDADGAVLAETYRKSHIPDGTGYQEKFYFSPGDTGFKVWKTAVGKVGVAICWDQWFPEAARAMALMGADVILYPTAIGTEPQDPTINSADHWQRTMQGHAAANVSRFLQELFVN